MNSGKRERERQHREMTALCRDANCLVCGKYGCVPAHYPHHRGMGGGKAGWSIDEIVPLCDSCHDAFDFRNGVSIPCRTRSMLVRSIVEKRAKGWRDRARYDTLPWTEEEEC